MAGSAGVLTMMMRKMIVIAAMVALTMIVVMIVTQMPTTFGQKIHYLGLMNKFYWSGDNGDDMVWTG